MKRETRKKNKKNVIDFFELSAGGGGGVRETRLFSRWSRKKKEDLVGHVPMSLVFSVEMIIIKKKENGRRKSTRHTQGHSKVVFHVF